MTIETKYNIGDNVLYITKSGTISDGTITVIKVSAHSGISLEIEYIVKPNDAIAGLAFNESEIFKSVEELLAYIKAQIREYTHFVIPQ